MKRQHIFKIIAISIPFILLIIVEVVLRITSYGNDYQLFHTVRVDDRPDYLIMNKKLAGKYFKDDGLRSDNQSDLFLKTKTDSTFRVVVQGASTVVGFPFYNGGSFPRILKHRLALTFPDKNIEVINTGITAVNSYTLWDLTDEIIDQQPDLVIIYAGHNEYYGALGVGSSISFGSHPLIIRTYLTLKKLRLFQLAENGYYQLLANRSNKPSERETTLMEILAKEQRIPFNSEVYEDGLEQFEDNLGRILAAYKKNNIPVMLSTVVSNVKDIKPFISDSLPIKTDFLKTIDGDKAMPTHMAKDNAMAAYLLGRHYLEKNRDSAMKYLQLAKELDYLRFRAPEGINDRIVALSEKYGNSLIDMKKVFASHSLKSIVGNELMTEHVHPNIKGQFLMADAFYEKIKELNFMTDWSNYIDFDEAFNNIPITRIDSLKGKLVVDDLKKSWPYEIGMTGKRPTSEYSGGSSFEELLAQDVHKNRVTWDNAMAIAYNTYKADKEYKKALTVSESLILEYPEQGRVYQMAGTMSSKLGDFDKAVYYFSKFNYLEKSSVSAEELAEVLIKSGDMAFAEQTLKTAQKRGLQVRNFDELVLEVTKESELH